jgi:hypothetical protein
VSFCFGLREIVIMRRMVKVTVLDLPVRVFHWVLAALV